MDRGRPVGLLAARGRPRPSAVGAGGEPFADQPVVLVPALGRAVGAEVVVPAVDADDRPRSAGPVVSVGGEASWRVLARALRGGLREVPRALKTVITVLAEGFVPHCRPPAGKRKRFGC